MKSSNRRFALMTSLVGAVLAVLLIQQAALAATVSVVIKDFFYDPATAKAKQGDTVQWTNQGSATHTATSTDSIVKNPNGSTGLSLWNSGNLSHGQTFPFTFSWAGKFPYYCKIHGSSMRGTIVVGLKAPSTAAVGQTFTITLGTSALPAGYVFDVQRQDPGDTKPRNWIVGTTNLTVQFMAPSAGTYSFRARVRKDNAPAGIGSEDGYGLYSALKNVSVS